MPNFSATAIFCEDIRQDVNGTHSLIGIFSDNITVPHIPGQMPKMGIYCRVLFHERQPATHLQFFLHRPNGVRDRLIDIEKDFVEKSFGEAEQSGNRQMTIFAQLIAVPFIAETSGRYWIELLWDGGSLDIGGINFKTDVSDRAAA